MSNEEPRDIPLLDLPSQEGTEGPRRGDPCFVDVGARASAEAIADQEKRLEEAASERVGRTRREKDGTAGMMTEDQAAWFSQLPKDDGRRYYEDVLWVSEYLDDPSVDVRDCPGRRCWSLLRWARDYRNDFFRTMLPKAAADAEKAEASNGGEDGAYWEPDRLENDVVEELQQMLQALVADSSKIQVTRRGEVVLPESAKGKK